MLIMRYKAKQLIYPVSLNIPTCYYENFRGENIFRTYLKFNLWYVSSCKAIICPVGTNIACVKQLSKEIPNSKELVLIPFGTLTHACKWIFYYYRSSN